MRGKKVIIYQQPVTRYVNRYTCPKCKVEFHGTGIAFDVLRFKCKCGQELIVEHYKEIKESG